MGRLILGENRIITNDLDSYWALLRFSADIQTGMVKITDAHVALYYSLQSNVLANDFPIQLNRGRGSYTISQDHTNAVKFAFSHAALQRAFREQFMGESKQLLLFDLDNTQTPSSWFSDVNFLQQANYVEPPVDLNNTTFLKRKLSLDAGQNGNMLNRYVHHIAWYETGDFTTSFMASLPFLKDSFFRILSKMGRTDTPTIAFPTLKLHVEKYRRNNGGKMALETASEWACFAGGNKAYPTAVEGYSMVCQGAFKHIPLQLSTMRDWCVQGASAPNGIPAQASKFEVMMERLSGVCQAATEAGRNLENVDDRTIFSVYPGSPDGPVEVLFLNGIQCSRIKEPGEVPV